MYRLDSPPHEGQHLCNRKFTMNDFYHFVTSQTDDKGVFSTDLSQEYQLAASTFGLSRDAVWKLSQQAIDCIFAPDAVKQQLRQKWADMKPQLLK